MLAWTSEWYVREETLRAANLAIIDYAQLGPTGYRPLRLRDTLF